MPVPRGLGVRKPLYEQRNRTSPVTACFENDENIATNTSVTIVARTALKIDTLELITT